MVLSMIHAMVCNAGMTIVCGVCGRTMRGGNQPSKPLNMELSLPLATVHRDSGCAFRAPGCADRPTDRARGRRRWTDRQTAPGPGRAGLWTDRARGRHRGGNSTPAGGSRPRRGVRVVAGAGKFRLRRGPPVYCRLSTSGPRGRGGVDFGGRACRSEPGGTRREEIRRHFGSKPAGISVAAPGRAAETRACARSRKRLRLRGCLVILWAGG